MNIKVRPINFAILVAFLLTSCNLQVRDPAANGPASAGNLRVTATADAATVFEGDSVNLSAAVEGGTAPVTLRWDQNAGPAATIAAPNSAQTTTSPLTQPGHYVFRVLVTDAAGLIQDDFAAVDVIAAVNVDAPAFAIVGELVTLSAQVDSTLESPTLLWEVTSGTATIGDASAASTTLTASRGETVKVRLTVSFASGDQQAATRDVDIVAVPDLHPKVRVETNQGDFVIELDGENTPNHMVNFLRYVDEGFYNGLLFHRNACTENQTTGACDPFVLQGGGYRRENGELVEVPPTHDPIETENATSPSNGVLYSVALALRGGSTATGAAQFFINLNADNGFLDQDGFTVFGEVVEGTDVVDALAATERVASPIIPGETSLPAQDIVIEQMVRAE